MTPTLRLPSIALAVALLLGPACAMAQEPGAFELELWRAAVRLNTADSYQEYLYGRRLEWPEAQPLAAAAPDAARAKS